jgi:hypothetical protein
MMANTTVTWSGGVARYGHFGKSNPKWHQVVSYVPMSGSTTIVTILSSLR